jgi:opacity protein-like surface antigen
MNLMRRFTLGLCLLAISASASAAQDQTPRPRVRVLSDNTIVWRPTLLTPAIILNAGAVLEVVGRRGNFYDVLAPSPDDPGGIRGFVAIAQVEHVAGSPLPPGATRETDALAPSAPAQPVTQTPAAPRSPARTSVRGFALAGYGWPLAHQTFNAVFDQSGAFWAGGGAEVQLGSGLFFLGSAQHMSQTGERVFVFDGVVTKAGIADSISITPIEATVGYRFVRSRHRPYVGAGAGQFRYRETFAFADPSEEIRTSFTSYHAIAGLEWRTARWMWTAVEVRFTHVPNALNGNLATAFDEHNLGGVETRVKVLFGK